MLRIIGSKRNLRSHNAAVKAATEAGHHGYIRESTKDGQFRVEWIPIAQTAKRSSH